MSRFEKIRGIFLLLEGGSIKKVLTVQVPLKQNEVAKICGCVGFLER